VVDYSEVIADLTAKRDVIDAALSSVRLMVSGRMSPPVVSHALSELPVRHTNGTKAKKAATKKRALPATGDAGEAKPLNGMKADIATILRAAPMSSREIFEKMRKGGSTTTIGSVYQTCAGMKESGLVETRVSESDGERRWHLIGAGAA